MQKSSVIPRRFDPIWVAEAIKQPREVDHEQRCNCGYRRTCPSIREPLVAYWSDVATRFFRFLNNLPERFEDVTRRSSSACRCRCEVADKCSGTIHHERCFVIVLEVFHALLHMRKHRGVTPVPDKRSRLLEAERALHGLEIQVEQYRVHLEELTQHPSEATKAHAMLEKIATELALQRKYYDLLKKAVPAGDRLLNGLRVA